MVDVRNHKNRALPFATLLVKVFIHSTARRSSTTRRSSIATMERIEKRQELHEKYIDRLGDIYEKMYKNKRTSVNNIMLK